MVGHAHTCVVPTIKYHTVLWYCMIPIFKATVKLIDKLNQQEHWQELCTNCAISRPLEIMLT